MAQQSRNEVAKKYVADAKAKGYSDQQISRALQKSGMDAKSAAKVISGEASSSRLAIAKKYVADAKAKGYSDEQILAAIKRAGLDEKTAKELVSKPSKAEKEVRDYVTSQRAQGFSDDQIRKELKKSGADPKLIDKVLGKEAVKSSLFKNPWFVAAVSLIVLALIIFGLFLVSKGTEEALEERRPEPPTPPPEPPTPPPELEIELCDYDIDCAEGEICDRGDCIPEPVEEDTDCGDGICAIGESDCDLDCPCLSSANCPDGFYCNTKRECQERSSGGGGGGGYTQITPPASVPDDDSGGSEAECTTDAECAEGYYCIDDDTCQITVCNDGSDNDLDGEYDFYGACDIDGALSNCQALGYDDAAACDTGCVNDLNGTYLPADTDCTSLDGQDEGEIVDVSGDLVCTVELPSCADGVDNDLDGLVDYQDGLGDPDCDSWEGEEVELPFCDNFGVDPSTLECYDSCTDDTQCALHASCSDGLCWPCSDFTGSGVLQDTGELRTAAPDVCEDDTTVTDYYCVDIDNHPKVVAGTSICEPGFICESGACVENTTYIECSEDCGAYTCDTETGQCRDSCTEHSECAISAACDLTAQTCHVCVDDDGLNRNEGFASSGVSDFSDLFVDTGEHCTGETQVEYVCEFIDGNNFLSVETGFCDGDLGEICQDGACVVETAGTTEDPTPLCGDGIDNDGDGKIDTDDLGCMNDDTWSVEQSGYGRYLQSCTVEADCGAYTDCYDDDTSDSLDGICLGPCNYDSSSDADDQECFEKFGDGFVCAIQGFCIQDTGCYESDNKEDVLNRGWYVGSTVGDVSSPAPGVTNDFCSGDDLHEWVCESPHDDIPKEIYTCLDGCVDGECIVTPDTASEDVDTDSGDAASDSDAVGDDEVGPETDGVVAHQRTPTGNYGASCDTVLDCATGVCRDDGKCGCLENTHCFVGHTCNRETNFCELSGGSGPRDFAPQRAAEVPEERVDTFMEKEEEPKTLGQEILEWFRSLFVLG